MLAAGVEVGGRPSDLYHAEIQKLQHLARGPRIVLLFRNDEGIRRGPVDGAPSDFIEIAEQIGPMNGSLIETAFERDELVIDDIAQTPRPALPRLQIIPTALAWIVSGRDALDLIGLHNERCRNRRAGGLAQNAQAAMIGLIVTRRRPEIVQRVNRDSLFAGRGQIDRHGRADRIALLGDDGVDIRINRVHPRRYKHTRGVGALLMHVVDDLRMPDIVQLRYGEPRFRLREDVPVAIVVVPDILLIQLRRRRAFVRRAQGFAIPARDDVDTVGVERGNQDEDRVVQDLLESAVYFP